MPKRWLVLVAIAAVAAFVVACGTDETTLPPSGGVGAQPDDVVVGVPNDTDTVTKPRDPDYEVVEVLAPIESVKVVALFSSPEQYAVQITSGLPSGCARFNRSEVTRDGTTVKISVYNTAPAPGQQIACTAIYGYYDNNVGLGGEFERGVEYTVLVNDHPAEKFTPGSSALSDVKIPDGFITELAPVESLEIVKNDDGENTATYYAAITWGLVNGCRESHVRTVSQVGTSTFEIQALVTAPEANVLCTELYRTESDRTYLGTVGKELDSCAVYTVLAGNKSAEFQAIAPNVRCSSPESMEPTDSNGETDEVVLLPGGNNIIADIQALELFLESTGAEVEFGGKSEFTKLFGLTPSKLTINGQSVQVYEFAPGTSAEEASEGVSASGTSIVNPDGSAMNVLWVAPPNFYLLGNSILLYLGNDAGILTLLASVADKFAGRDFEDTSGSIGDSDSDSDGGSIEDEYTYFSSQIEKVSIASTKSIPARFVVSVVVVLANGCEEFGEADWFLKGNDVFIEISTKAPTAPMICTMAIEYSTQSINIGSAYEAGVEYNVIVNDERMGTFVGI